MERVASLTRFESSLEAEVAARCAGARVVVNKELPLGEAVIAALPDTVESSFSAAPYSTSRSAFGRGTVSKYAVTRRGM